MEWISLKDELPSYGRRVLLITKGVDNELVRLGLRSYTDKDGEHFNPSGLHTTHWMELPKPPNK